MERCVRAGAGAADGVVGSVWVPWGESRSDARAEADRFAQILDPGRPVAEMVTAFRVRSARNEREQLFGGVHPVAGWRELVAGQRKGIPRVRQAVAENHDPVEGTVQAVARRRPGGRQADESKKRSEKPELRARFVSVH